MTPRQFTIGATVLGYPRIGRRRELKQALEGFWDGTVDGAELDAVATRVRRDGLHTMQGAGLDTVPVNTFSWYDQMLDTMVLLGAVPARFEAVTGEHRLAGFDAARYFAMARGTASIPPLEMTKWFDTNYHYLVPEIGPETLFTLHPGKPLAEFREAVAQGITARPVIIGPLTFLSLAKPTDDASGFQPLERLDDLVPLYAQLLGELATAGVECVQLDEPTLVRDLDDAAVHAVGEVYRRLAALPQRPAILVATYFGPAVEALPALAATDIEAIALDLVHGAGLQEMGSAPGLKGKTLVLGVVNGRNIWRTDPRAALDTLREWAPFGTDVAVSTSCSLLHVPYDVQAETGLDPDLRAGLAFADQKLAEVVSISRLLDGHAQEDGVTTRWDEACARREHLAGLRDPGVVSRVGAVDDADRVRPPQTERDIAQAAALQLPALVTTTIGSFPQTAQVRSARADHRAGRITADEYDQRMREEIRRVVALQEELGLDVLVHGEPERNDMVQYFAEHLAGYAPTTRGWVQSYGSRCVRPPILYGDVARPEPMTVAWSAYAQSLTSKPVKGMLTGPVTMLAWSFVRDDQPRSVTADQLALALRDELADLEAAGLGIIQVDEPALRELLPLRLGEQAAYLDWAVGAFRLATSGVATSTQVHTHLCYSEFGEIVRAIDGLHADVTSIEAARSRMEVLTEIEEVGFGGSLGPGVYDIHSPRVPSEVEVKALLTLALRSMPADKLWVNPDCGLKTRGYPEVEASLRHLVHAARALREERSA